MPDEPDPPRKIYQLGKTEFERVNPTVGDPGAAAPHQDIHAVLRENLAKANAAGINEVSYREPRPSRRKRDYWTLLLVVNAFFSAAPIHFGLASIPGMFGLGGIIFFSVALTWVMWFIMDDY